MMMMTIRIYRSHAPHEGPAAAVTQWLWCSAAESKVCEIIRKLPLRRPS